jgi:DNA repair protein RadC
MGSTDVEIKDGTMPGQADDETILECLGCLLRGRDSRDAGRALAARLLAESGGLRALCDTASERPKHRPGLGARRLELLSAVPVLATRYFSEAIRVGEPIRSPRDTEAFLAARMRHLEHERFCCLFLDNRHRVLEFEELFRGTIDGTSVYPREVVKEALRVNAAAVILAHNHPSGVAEPSQADERITRRLKAALELVDIRLLDHLVVGDAHIVSLASRGLV